MRAIVVGFALLSACSSSSTGTPDAAAAIPDAMTADAGAFGTCKTNVTSGNNGGHHNAGMDCMDGCHNHGFTLAGTLYTTSAGTTTVSGATISVLDAAGKTVNMVVQTNGNFYTSTSLTFPVGIEASDCPSLQAMMAPLAKGSDNGCNQSGCHASGTSQGRIHLP